MNKLIFIKIVRIFILTFILTSSLPQTLIAGFDKLNFEKILLNIKPNLEVETVNADFKFVYEGDTPMKLVESSKIKESIGEKPDPNINYVIVKKSCSCLSLSFGEDKNKIYKKGDSGLISATYGINPSQSKSGATLVPRSIAIFDYDTTRENPSSNPKDKKLSKILNVKLVIPYFYIVTPTKLKWNIGDPITTKVVNIKINKKIKDFKLQKADIKHAAAYFRSVVERVDDYEYNVKITPRYISKDLSSEEIQVLLDQEVIALKANDTKKLNKLYNTDNKKLEVPTSGLISLYTNHKQDRLKRISFVAHIIDKR